jgi:hypothetical protein
MKTDNSRWQSKSLTAFIMVELIGMRAQVLPDGNADAQCQYGHFFAKSSDVEVNRSSSPHCFKL